LASTNLGNFLILILKTDILWLFRVSVIIFIWMKLIREREDLAYFYRPFGLTEYHELLLNQFLSNFQYVYKSYKRTNNAFLARGLSKTPLWLSITRPGYFLYPVLRNTLSVWDMRTRTYAMRAHGVNIAEKSIDSGNIKSKYKQSTSLIYYVTYWTNIAIIVILFLFSSYPYFVSYLLLVLMLTSVYSYAYLLWFKNHGHKKVV